MSFNELPAGFHIVYLTNKRGWIDYHNVRVALVWISDTIDMHFESKCVCELFKALIGKDNNGKKALIGVVKLTEERLYESHSRNNNT